MNYLKYNYENGLTTYLQTDGILNVDLSYRKGVCFINLISHFRDKVSNIIVPIPIELADKKDYDILEEVDHDNIFLEFTQRFTVMFEEALLDERHVMNFNAVVKRLSHCLGIFARDIVEDRKNRH